MAVRRIWSKNVVWSIDRKSNSQPLFSIEDGFDSWNLSKKSWLSIVNKHSKAMASKGEQWFWVCLIIITPNASLMADVVIILFHHHIRQAFVCKTWYKGTGHTFCWCPRSPRDRTMPGILFFLTSRSELGLLYSDEVYAFQVLQVLQGKRFR